MAQRLVAQTTSAVNSQGRSNAPGGQYSTGTLKASINWSMSATKVTVTGVSGSPLIYAHSVHTGQPARRIVPRNARMLRFYWRRTGRVEHFRSVNHPGTQANPYLTDALKAVAPRYGFKVVIYD